MIKTTTGKACNESLPSSISGGSPPTNTFLENLSMPKSRSDLGEPFNDEPSDGTI